MPQTDHYDGISSDFSDGSLQAEEARIRAAYARRNGDDVRYSLFNSGHLFMMQEREREVLALLRRHDFTVLGVKTILEIGCGAGYWLREFTKWGAKPDNIIGVELIPEYAAEARRLCPSGIKIECGSAAKLPFSDETFDLILQSTVFTSILDSDMKQRVAAEMIRVMKKKGVILWYDYHVNNPSNPNVQGVKKREIDRLFDGCRIDLRRITLAPPLVRLLAPYSWLAAYCLSKIPLLCTHYLGVIQKD